MKTPFRALLLALGIPTALILLVWGGGILYWHVRITRALRAWEKNPTVTQRRSSPPEYGPPEAVAVIREAGCRALPSLIRSLDESKDPRFLRGVSDHIWLFVTFADREAGPAEEALAERRANDWLVHGVDSTPRKQQKCAALREWWRAEGSAYHQWWRFWSDQCPR